jgi:glycosyltransferase involved in cell wall biosynthesis
MQLYSIIIPIYNESRTLETLLNGLLEYSTLGHEVIIVNDGSTDNSKEVLKRYSFIKHVELKSNYGKGIALRIGLLQSKFNKVIISDGDLELKTNDLKKLMILNKKKNIYSCLGIRSIKLHPMRSGVDWGNFIFTFFFNLLHNTCYKDILCCAKSFYRDDIPIDKLKSIGFDIDVELSTFITLNNGNKKIKQILIDYQRRSFEEGKKLKISDGWIILKRIILCL